MSALVGVATTPFLFFIYTAYVTLHLHYPQCLVLTIHNRNLLLVYVYHLCYISLSTHDAPYRSYFIVSNFEIANFLLFCRIILENLRPFCNLETFWIAP